MKLFRRQYLIHRRFQFTFIGYMVLVAGFVGAAFYGANLRLHDGLAEALESAGVNDPGIQLVLAEQRAIMSRIHLIVALGSTIIVTITGLFISHKVAGPMFRMFNVLRDPEKLERELKFRKDDFFKEVAAAINDPKSMGGFYIRPTEKKEAPKT